MTSSSLRDPRRPTGYSRPLTALFDATAIPADRGGVGRYVENLVPELVTLGVSVVVACQPRDRAGFEAAGAQKVVEIPAWGGRASGRLVWEQVSLPALARSVGATVIHSPHYTFPVFTRVKRVVTVHDLTFFTDPALHGRLKRVFFRTWIRAAKALRVTVVTPSRTTADEYRRLTHAAGSRVFAAPLGYDETVFHVPSAADVAQFRASLVPEPGEWVAFLGTLEPRKNVSALVKAFAEVSAARNPTAAESKTADSPGPVSTARAASGRTAPALAAPALAAPAPAAAAEAPVGRPALLLAGGAGWDTTVADAVADARSKGCDVRLLGYLPLDRLRSLLGGSLVAAYPSLGEGFGLPVLEAMACGAAVLTTRRLSLPEVGGDAVAYCDVDSTSIANSLATLLSDATERRRLSAAGVERARVFTWRSCAENHVRAYRAALGGTRSGSPAAHPAALYTSTPHTSAPHTSPPHAPAAGPAARGEEPA